jgi:membrane fusion protein (multidrug efflux system)
LQCLGRGRVGNAELAASEFALIPPDNAAGNFTKIVRRFTMRIRFNARDANAALARPGMSVETAVAISTPDNAAPTERGNRVDCVFDPSKDMVERTLTKLPEHPGLGRARPQGSSVTQVPVPPTTLVSSGDSSVARH